MSAKVSDRLFECPVQMPEGEQVFDHGRYYSEQVFVVPGEFQILSRIRT